MRLLFLIFFSLFFQYTIQIHHSSAIVKEWYNDTIHISLHKDMIDEYQFTVNINRNNCKPTTTKMNKTSIEHFIEREIGNDEILLEIEGDNMISFLGKYAYCGSYHKTFTITKSGLYDVKATLLSINNNINIDEEAFNQQQAAVTLMSDTIYLNKSFGNFCPKHINGVWTLMSDTNITIPASHPASPSSSSCLDYAIKYYWDSGHSCGFPPISQQLGSTILSNITFQCLGDDSLSYFCSLFLKWACDVTTDNPYLKIPENSNLCRNLTVISTKDETCKTLSNHSATITLFNCGHNSETIDTFKSIIESVSLMPSHSSSLLWLEMEPLLNNKKESLRSLEMKNRYATQRFSSSHSNNNIIVIPSFHSLLPFYKICSNNNNNDNNKLLVPVYEEILRHIKKLKESRNL